MMDVAAMVVSAAAAAMTLPDAFTLPNTFSHNSPFCCN